RQLMSEIEGSPFPGHLDAELYAIWYEHAQKCAQEALEYLHAVDPEFGREGDFPAEFA
ncbi:MAG: hypothetical protein JNG85_16000, partial [Spirochaetaceae bacterium]|nr:hypothetical protein [Spirochaetaceae bacterium]